AVQALEPQWHALFAMLARETGMGIQAGTFLTATGDGRYRNRAWWYAPDGSRLFQDKLQLTGFEKQLGIIEGGDALEVFEAWPGVRAGISICYDSEFPLPVRAQAEAGARLLLVPSCTDTEAGATRVRTGCLARALENRMFVAQSVTAGEAPWSPALDGNTGEAAIYAPMDAGLPADGIVATTRGDDAWAVADLDFDALDASRAHAPPACAEGLGAATQQAPGTCGRLAVLVRRLSVDQDQVETLGHRLRMHVVGAGAHLRRVEQQHVRLRAFANGAAVGDAEDRGR